MGFGGQHASTGTITGTVTDASLTGTSSKQPADSGWPFSNMRSNTPVTPTRHKTPPPSLPTTTTIYATCTPASQTRKSHAPGCWSGMVAQPRYEADRPVAGVTVRDAQFFIIGHFSSTKYSVQQKNTYNQQKNLSSGEAGSAGLHAAHGCSRRHGRRQAAGIVRVRLAGLGGCAAGLAASFVSSSEAGSSGIRAAHGCSRRQLTVVG